MTCSHYFHLYVAPRLTGASHITFSLREWLLLSIHDPINGLRVCPFLLPTVSENADTISCSTYLISTEMNISLPFSMSSSKIVYKG